MSNDNNHQENKEEEEEILYPDCMWSASEYRSKFVRTKREDTQKLDPDDLSKLGHPTYINALPWSAHLKALLCGVKDPTCCLSMFAGCEDTVLKKIYSMIVDDWKQNIVICPPAHNVCVAKVEYAWGEADYAKVDDFEKGVHSYSWGRRVRAIGQKPTDRPEIAFSLVGSVTWPEPKDRNVNMLPFIMGDINSLPKELHPYHDMILQCPVKEEEMGKVLYLTVSEGYVDAKATQRRSGLHIEAAGGVSDGVGGNFLAGTESNWGGGVSMYADYASPDQFDGGLYLASNIDDTCKLWDALVSKGRGVTDYHGGGEHLRPFIGEGTTLKANELAWLTDRTPHEAIPQAKSGYRQFFRLVTSNISVWFKQHSTENPMVPLPDCVKVIEGNKFAARSNASESPANAAKHHEDTKPAAKKLKTSA